jgi:hypothetical protein
MSLKMLIVLLLVELASIISIASGTIQVFPSDYGNIQLDLPLVLTREQVPGSSDDLNLGVTTDTPLPSGRPFPGMIPVITINFKGPDDYPNKASDYYYIPEYPDYQYPVSEMQTNDGHKMWFITELYKGEIQKYYVLIDHSEINRTILIHALRSVYYGKQIALFEPVDFQKICKSFAFV